MCYFRILRLPSQLDQELLSPLPPSLLISGIKMAESSTLPYLRPLPRYGGTSQGTSVHDFRAVYLSTIKSKYQIESEADTGLSLENRLFVFVMFMCIVQQLYRMLINTYELIQCMRSISYV